MNAVTPIAASEPMAEEAIITRALPHSLRGEVVTI